MGGHSCEMAAVVVQQQQRWDGCSCGAEVAVLVTVVEETHQMYIASVK